MIKRFTRFALVAILAVGLTAPLLAQGTQTGTLRGVVKSEAGDPIPGVTVTVSSPALLGEKTTQTTQSGEWLIRALTPGEYTISYTLEGMQPAQTTATVELGQTTPVTVVMRPADLEETIVVTTEESTVLSSSQVSTTYKADEIEAMPIGRTPAAIATLAPGLTTNTPNAGQVTISGGFAYDNVFLIDGVDANDNLFGTSNPVFIEEAIADVQVLTSGISAEYGRFSGGVVNIVTKTGGNEFSGSLRADATNEDWREETPLEEERGTELPDEINEFYSATLGGYVVPDRLWFFVAGRDESTSTQDTFAATGLPEPNSTDEERYEGKLTFNVTDRHQLQGQYTEREQTAVRGSFGFSATPATLRTRTDPNELFVARYNGALTNSIFGEVQYSEKEFTFMNTHGDEGLVESSPFLTFLGLTPAGELVNTPFIHWNAPYFDGTDPEDRNNEQAYGALSWFADAGDFGTHDVKFGVEDFTSKRVGGNSQSPTSFVFYPSALVDNGGNYIVGPDDRLTPAFVPGVNYAINWVPTRGAEIEINTLSAFVNDSWRLNDHWSFNVGVRYEDVESDATGGITTIDTSRVVPRLGASYDLRGDGKYRFDATYGQYSGKYSESQFAENTVVGNPRGVFLVYAGPFGIGRDFAPGFDLNNYVPFGASDATANQFVADDIQSPVVDEWTLSAGMGLPRGGYLKAIYTNREYSDFVESFTCTADPGVPCPGPGDTGVSFVTVEGIDVGLTNNEVLDNSDVPSREYQAIQVLGAYSLTDVWNLQGSWTYQIENDGNFEGEGTNTPGIDSTYGEYPGYFVEERHYPTGTLNDFQEHKIRLWTTYNLDLGRAGTLTTSLLGNYNSGTTFSFVASIPRGFSQQQRDILEHYESQPGSTQGIFFGERGRGEFPSYTTFDLGLLYTLPVITDWGLEAFISADVFNIFNEDKAITYNTDVNAVLDGPVDEFGLPTEFTRGDAFGEPQDNDNFVDPREYRLGIGFRF